MSYLIPYIFLVLLSIRNNKKFNLLTSIFIWIFLVIFIGFRFEVGADWFNYQTFVKKDGADETYMSLIFRGFAPGYALLLKFCSNYGLGVYGLNVINAGIFSGGLVYFCNKLKNPFLGLVASYPYLIVVVSMGVINQASAIGILLIGLTFYQISNYKAFYLSIVLASMFHTSAFLSIIIPFFDRIRNIKRKSSFISLSLLASFFGIIYLRYLNDIFISLYNSYFGREMEAQGGLIKLLIMLMFAVIFLIQRNKFQITNQQKDLLLSLSTISILVFFYSLTIKATTATYRLSLYFYSLILYVTSYFPDTRFLNIAPITWKFIFYIYNFLILTIWIFFANHSYAWLPYKNILLENIF